MKKWIHILVAILLVGSITVLSVFIYTYFPIRCEYLTGKDTVTTFGNGMYQIAKLPNDKTLVMNHEKNHIMTVEYLLRYVSSYRKFLEKAYVKADDGYAVVNRKDNTCKLLLTEENKSAMGFSEVQYITTFEEFTAIEQFILNTLD